MTLGVPKVDTEEIFSEEDLPGQPRILIAGLGNSLLQDDGVGVHAVRELRKAALPGVLAVEVGTAVLDALHLFEWADKILAIDAMEAGGSPGTIYVFGVGDIEEHGLQASLHELSLLAALRFLPQGPRPEIVVLGMEPETIDYGLDVSPSLQASLPQLVQAAREIIASWGSNRAAQIIPGPETSNKIGRPRSNLILQERSES